MSFTKTQNKFSKGIDDKADGTAVTINEVGNVGVGMEPETATFKLSAKEQLAEWKTKAKASTWSEVTDGEFSQEPTEDLVAEWIETRSVHYQNSKLQLKGYLGFGLNGGAILKVEDPGNSASGSGLATLGVTALSDSSKRWFTFGESVQDNAEGLKASVIKVSGGKLRFGVGASDTKGLLINEAGDVTFDNNVGVGTSDISELAGKPTIHVNDGSGNGAIRIGNGANDGGNVFLDHSDADGARIRSNSTDMNIGAGAGQDLHFFTGNAGTTRLTINEDGNVGINAEPKADQPLVVHEAGTGYGGGIESGTKNVGGNAGYKFSTADVVRWSMSLQGGADEENIRFIKHKSDGSLTKMFGVDHAGDAMIANTLSVGGDDFSGQFETAAPSVTVGATYGAKISGNGGGIGLFGSNIVVNNADNMPVVQNSHSNYGAMGLSFGWGGMKVWRKGGAVTSGDAVEEIGTWNHEGLIVDDTVTVGGTSKVDSQELIGSYQVMYPGVAGGGSWFWSGNQQGIFYIKAGGTWDGGVEAMRLSGTGNVIFGGTVNGTRMIQDGAPVIDAKGLISTLSTLRNATKDETTLEGLRDSIGNAIGGLIEKFEAEIAAMPAPEIETGTMEIDA